MVDVVNIEHIVAMSVNGVIGFQNKVPWHSREEMRHFKKITTGNIVLMGRKTFESINKALPNRINIVLSSQKIRIPNVISLTNMDDVVDYCHSMNTRNNFKKLFVIGGASLYEQTFMMTNTFWISIIYKNFIGDTYYPYHQQWLKCMKQHNFTNSLLVHQKNIFFDHNFNKTIISMDTLTNDPLTIEFARFNVDNNCINKKLYF